MIQMVTMTRLRDNLGRYVHDAEHDQSRYVILRNGREAAGLVSVRELNLLDNAATRSLDYKAFQIAEEMMRWRIIREGMAVERGRDDAG